MSLSPPSAFTAASPPVDSSSSPLLSTLVSAVRILSRCALHARPLPNANTARPPRPPFDAFHDDVVGVRLASTRAARAPRGIDAVNVKAAQLMMRYDTRSIRLFENARRVSVVPAQEIAFPQLGSGKHRSPAGAEHWKLDSIGVWCFRRGLCPISPPEIFPSPRRVATRGFRQQLFQSEWIVFSHRGRHPGICLCFHWRFMVEMAGVKAVVWIVVFRRYPRSGIGLVT